MLIKKIIASLVMTVATSAFAWQPTKPIDVTVGFTAGSNNDIIFRALAAEVEKNTGAKFSVTYRPGAGGVIGTKHLSQQPADGYHMISASMLGLYAMDVLNSPEAAKSYSTDSFTYVLEMAQANFAVIANVNDPVTTAKQFVDLLGTKQPITLGSLGGSRLVQESLKDRLRYGDNVVWVQHKGPVDQITDVASGNLRFSIAPSSVVVPFLADKPKVKVIAVTGANRDAVWPSVDTLNSVLPGMIIPGEWGLLGPKGLPADVVEWYRKEFTRALQSPQVKEIYAKNLLSVNPAHLDPKTFEKYSKSQAQKYSPLMKKLLADQETKK